MEQKDMLKLIEEMEEHHGESCEAEKVCWELPSLQDKVDFMTLLSESLTRNLYYLRKETDLLRKLYNITGSIPLDKLMDLNNYQEGSFTDILAEIAILDGDEESDEDED